MESHVIPKSQTKALRWPTAWISDDESLEGTLCHDFLDFCKRPQCSNDHWFCDDFSNISEFHTVNHWRFQPLFLCLQFSCQIDSRLLSGGKSFSVFPEGQILFYFALKMLLFVSEHPTGFLTLRFDRIVISIVATSL